MMVLRDIDFTHSFSFLRKSLISSGVITSPLEAITLEICSIRILHFLSLVFGRKDCTVLCMVRPTGTEANGTPNTAEIPAATFRLIGCVSLEGVKDREGVCVCASGIELE